MTVQPAVGGSRDPGAEGVPPAETPRAIRQVLLPEEAGQFDSEWRRMLRRADRVLAGQERGSVTADHMREMVARRLG